MTSHREETSTEKEEFAANALVEEILGATKPKHLGEGLTSGLGYIIKGTIGGIGTAVLTPVVAAAEGHKDSGVFGGIVGGAFGVVGGLLHGANTVGGGIVTGVSQVVQGAAATPTALMAPQHGKWWNLNEGAWMTTNLLDDERWIHAQSSEYDEDILGELAMPEEERPSRTSTKTVKDTTLYDRLGLDPSVDTAMIKRRYFIVGRKYSPDRAGANPKAQEEFQQIGRAYMILTNPELRAKYDRVGYARLWEEEDGEPDIDPYLLQTCLYGSEKFQDYIGRLVAATEARVGDPTRSRVTFQQARLLQKRRVTRLALSLADRLSLWAEDDLQMAAKAKFIVEADALSDASYGIELVHVIGKVYSLSAVQFLGSLDSGIGMPSISQWAKKQTETLKLNTQGVVTQVKTFGGDPDRHHLTKAVETAMDKSEGDADAEEVAKDILRKSSLQHRALHILWQQSVVDITATLHEAAQMVLFDQNVTEQVRKKRGQALACLGEVFEDCPGKTDPIPEQAGLEEIAFHAMLNTVWRKELTAREHAATKNYA